MPHNQKEFRRMPRPNVDDLYTAKPDGHGGVSLRLKPRFERSVNNTLRRMRVRDAAGSDETHIHLHMPTGITSHTQPKPSLDEAVQRHIQTRNAAMPGAEPPPTSRLKKFATDADV